MFLRELKYCGNDIGGHSFRIENHQGLQKSGAHTAICHNSAEVQWVSTKHIYLPRRYVGEGPGLTRTSDHLEDPDVPQSSVSLARLL